MHSLLDTSYSRGREFHPLLLSLCRIYYSLFEIKYIYFSSEIDLNFLQKVIFIVFLNLNTINRTIYFRALNADFNNYYCYILFYYNYFFGNSQIPNVVNYFFEKKNRFHPV